MPGAYAHITVVNQLKEPGRLEAITGFPRDAIAAVLDYVKFCELGCVSPDYPYLAIGDARAAAWADTMHYERTGEMIQAGIRRLRALRGEAQRKGLAWLLGYAAHVTTDVTIHPVVERKVGPYAANKTAHRVCEMHQDAYIFQRLNLGEVGLSEYLDSGIGRCHAEGDPERLDADIESLWTGMLQAVHPVRYAANPPDVHKWHRRFKPIVDNIAEEGGRLLPFARHVAADQGVVYPAEIDTQYIEALACPTGLHHYDEIFDHAVRNVGEVWRHVARGVLGDDELYMARLGNWNLDTGRNEDGEYVFWS